MIRCYHSFSITVGRPVTDRSPGVGAWTYGQACDQLNVARQTAVTEGLGNEQLNLAGRNLGPRDLIPLAKALQVNGTINYYINIPLLVVLCRYLFYHFMLFIDCFT